MSPRGHENKQAHRRSPSNDDIYVTWRRKYKRGFNLYLTPEWTIVFSYHIHIHLGQQI